jgi:hypothetical protein
MVKHLKFEVQIQCDLGQKESKHLRCALVQPVITVLFSFRLLLLFVVSSSSLVEYLLGIIQLLSLECIWPPIWISHVRTTQPSYELQSAHQEKQTTSSSS